MVIVPGAPAKKDAERPASTFPRRARRAWERGGFSCICAEIRTAAGALSPLSLRSYNARIPLDFQGYRLKIAKRRPCGPRWLNVVAERKKMAPERKKMFAERIWAQIKRSKMAFGAHGFRHPFGVEYQPGATKSLGFTIKTKSSAR